MFVTTKRYQADRQADMEDFRAHEDSLGKSIGTIVSELNRLRAELAELKAKKTRTRKPKPVTEAVTEDVK